MAASALALQWTLDQSTAQALSTIKDVLHAATTDNVQPIALLAAEAFGASLPLSEQSRRIVEKAVSRRSSSLVFEHLKIKIGWSKNDSVTWLSRSDAGIRFLGLATTLSTMDDAFRAASCLDQLIRDSAPQNTQLPTLGQLQDLLEAVMPQLSGIGFEDKVLGAAALTRAFEHDENGHNKWHQLYNDTCSVPDIEQIIALVDAVKRFGRICEVHQHKSSLARITIATAEGFPWLYAFLNWMLGVPPGVVFGNSENSSGLNSHANVLLVLDLSLKQKQGPLKEIQPVTIRIAIYENLTAPSQLWSPSGDSSWMVGGVSLEAFGQYVLAWSSMFCQTKPESFFSILASVLVRLLNAPIWGSEDEDLTACRPWPGTFLGTAIVQVLQLTFGPLAAEAFRSVLAPKFQRSDINLSMIKETHAKIFEDESYLGRVSLLILALACFDVASLQSLKLVVPATLQPTYGDTLEDSLIEWLQNSDQSFSITSRDLYMAALEFTAGKCHTDVTNHWYNPLALFKNGQVVYGAHLGSPRVQKNSPVMLSAAAGHIHYQGDTFLSVFPFGAEDIYKKPKGFQFRNAGNVSESSELLWTVRRGDPNLFLAVGLTGLGGQTNISELQPCSLEQMFWLPACAHAPDTQTQLPEEGVEATFVHASQLANMDSADDGRIRIVDVARDEAQSFFAFACATMKHGERPGIVFKGDSCSACSLGFCKRKRCKILIL